MSQHALPPLRPKQHLSRRPTTLAPERVRPRCAAALATTPYCRRCGLRLCAFDDRAGRTRRGLTPTAEQLASLAGAVGISFGKIAHLLEEKSGQRLSESSVPRVTEVAKARLPALLARGMTCRPRMDWYWHSDARGRMAACVAVDASPRISTTRGGS
jgi:hypothetical protein